jgi:glycerol-1-phosphate dehydrogenase [NAD(P)+]
MPTHLPVVIGPDPIPQFEAFCEANGLSRFALIADDNTYRALGDRVEAAVRAHGWDVKTILLQGDDIGADASSVYQVLVALDGGPRTFLPVGSGTITDVARFVSHRIGAGFISLPTAASVDGFTSIGAPMIVDGAKVTLTTQGPLAVFADLPTLCAAPRPLIAAGFGDLIAKLTSVADWELGALLWDEPFDAEIAGRARQAAWGCIDRIDAVARGDSDGIEALMTGLIESGFCMLDFGETRPASGYEHQMSHFWEMTLLREGHHSLLHGAKVGVGVIASARVYDWLRALSPEDARRRASEARLPDREADVAEIHRGYGPLGSAVVANHAAILDMTQAQFDEIRRRTGRRWDEVQRIAATVPASAQVEAWLRQVGGPVNAGELGITEEAYRTGVNCAHFYRSRFNGKKLARLLGVSSQ